MKKLIAIFMMTISIQSFAQVRRWFYQPINCFIDGRGASCQTTNYRFNSIFCEAQAFAQTSYGYVLNGFYQGWIQPGQSAFVYVRANNPFTDPVIRANATARCLF